MPVLQPRFGQSLLDAAPPSNPRLAVAVQGAIVVLGGLTSLGHVCGLRELTETHEEESRCSLSSVKGPFATLCQQKHPCVSHTGKFVPAEENADPSIDYLC